MAKPNLPRPQEEPGTGAEAVPPGATRGALDRPRNPRPQGPNKDEPPERTLDDPQNPVREAGRGGR
jgi:hypothetical protein